MITNDPTFAETIPADELTRFSEWLLLFQGYSPQRARRLLYGPSPAAIQAYDTFVRWRRELKHDSPIIRENTRRVMMEFLASCRAPLAHSGGSGSGGSGGGGSAPGTSSNNS